MAEVMVFLSATQATTQLIEQSFRIIGRIRTAYLRDKYLGNVLTCHEHELHSIKSIIGLIEDFDDFQTPPVAEELHRLHEIQNKLTDLLKALDPRAKSKGSRLLHQLAEGSSDEKKLSSVMNELGHVKTTLILKIQTANVGVTRGIGKTLVANTILIERIDETLRDHVKDCEGLRIARLIQGRRPSNDGLVPLTLADLRALSNDCDESDSEDSSKETLVDDSESVAQDVPVKTERIILQNVTRDQAFQINGPIGEDIWKKIDRLVIRDNIAEGQSVQVNYPLTIHGLKLLMEAQMRNVEHSNKPIRRKRHDSMDP